MYINNQKILSATFDLAQTYPWEKLSGLLRCLDLHIKKNAVFFVVLNLAIVVQHRYSARQLITFAIDRIAAPVVYILDKNFILFRQTVQKASALTNG